MSFESLTPLDEIVFHAPKKDTNLFKFNKDKYDEMEQNGFRLDFLAQNRQLRLQILNRSIITKEDEQEHSKEQPYRHSHQELCR